MASTIDEHWEDSLPDPESPLGGLGWLLALACTFNFFVFPCLRAIEGGNDAIVFLGGAAVGMFPAQLGALTLWLVWGPGPFLRRLAIHWLGGLALFAAWALGMAIAFGADAPARELPTVWGTVLCSLPLVSLAAQLPLWPLRTHFGWRVERLDDPPVVDQCLALSAARQPLAIRDLLIGTVVTAVALAGIRGVAALTDMNEGNGQLDLGYWLGWGMAVLITAAISLLGFLPAMWLMLRGSEPAPRIGVWLGYVAVVGLVVIVITAGLFRGGPGPEPFVGLVCLLSSFALALAGPILLVRSRGWRLVLPTDQSRDVPRLHSTRPPLSAKVASAVSSCDTPFRERDAS